MSVSQATPVVAGTLAVYNNGAALTKVTNKGHTVLLRGENRCHGRLSRRAGRPGQRRFGLHRLPQYGRIHHHGDSPDGVHRRHRRRHRGQNGRVARELHEQRQFQLRLPGRRRLRPIRRFVRPCREIELDVQQLHQRRHLHRHLRRSGAPVPLRWAASWPPATACSTIVSTRARSCSTTPTARNIAARAVS